MEVATRPWRCTYPDCASCISPSLLRSYQAHVSDEELAGLGNQIEGQAGKEPVMPLGDLLFTGKGLKLLLGKISGFFLWLAVGAR